MENFYDELFNSQKNLINAWKNNLENIGDKEDFIDHFNKIEKLNKKLREEFYKSSLEMIKSMEIFFPEEKEIWNNEKLAHKEIFISPLDLFYELNKEYSFYKLIYILYEGDIVNRDYVITSFKEDYLKYLKKYLTLISAKGFKDIYKNYIEILKKSNKLMENIMTPISEVINIEEYKKSLDNPEYLRKNKKRLLESVDNLNDIDFKEFYKYSIMSQEEIVGKVKRFSEVTMSYYDKIFNLILSAIDQSNYDYRLIEHKIENRSFEEYYIFIKKRVEYYLEDDLNSENFNNLLSYTIDETIYFLNTEDKSEVDKLKEEIRILKERIYNLEKK